MANPTNQRSTRRRPFGFFVRAGPVTPSIPRRHRQPALDRGPRSGARRDRDLPIQRTHPVDDPLEPGATGGLGRIEAAAVVGHREAQRMVSLGDRHGGRGRGGVLRDVLHRLEAREVHGRFDILRVPGDRVGADLDRQTRLPRLRLERRDESLVRQERRIDAPGEVAEILQRGVGLALELADQLARLLRVPFDQAVGELELDGERHQLLLRAVVDVALQPPALGILRGDQPLLRGLQIVQSRLERLGQSHVAEHESGLGTPDRRSASRPTERRDRSTACGPRARPGAHPPARPGTRDPCPRSAAPTRSGAGSADDPRRPSARPRRLGAPGRRPATRRRARLRSPRPGSAPSAAARPRRHRLRRRVPRTRTAPRTASRACRTPGGSRTASGAREPVGT